MSADLGHWTTPRRPVRCVLVDIPEPGKDTEIFLESRPATLHIPVLMDGGFGARVLHRRVTRADHLGPTEAEYREVEA